MTPRSGDGRRGARRRSSRRGRVGARALAASLLLLGAPVAGAATLPATPTTPATPAPAATPPTAPPDSDPAPPDVESVTLDDAVRRALAGNPSVAVAVEEIRRAEALVTEVRAGALPTLTGNVIYTRLDDDRRLSGRVIAAQDQLAANLLLTVPLVAPQRWLQWRHAGELVDIASVSAAEARRQLAIAVGRTWLALVAQHHNIAVLLRARQTAQAHFDYARARRAGGYGTRIDEVRAGQEIAVDRAQLEGAFGQLARLREALSVLIASDHAVDVPAAARDAASDATGDPEAAAGLAYPPPAEEAARELAGRRSDVRLGQARLRNAEDVRDDSYADFLPSLALTFQPFYQNPPTLTQPELGWQANLVLSLPLYDGGFRYGARREREALVGEAKSSLAGTLRQAGSDVRAADAALRSARAALEAARDGARLAAEGLHLTTLAYQAGATTNIEVIDAERRARDADTTVAAAADTARQATLDLLVAAGRFP